MVFLAVQILIFSSNSNTNSYALKTSIYREVFHLVLVGISRILSSSSFHQTVGPRNGWGEGGSVSFRFLAPGNAARVFLQPGPRGMRLSRGRCGPWRRAGAWLNHGAGPGHGAGRGLPRSATRGRVSGWQLAVQPSATAPVARAECSQAPCGSSRCPGSHRAISLPPERRPGGALAREHRGSSRDTQEKVKPGSQSGRTPARCRIAPPRLFQGPQRGARGESGVRGAGRSDWDTEDGRADLARGPSLLPPAGSRGVCPKRGRAELRRSSETFPGACLRDLSRGCRTPPRAGKARTVGEGQAPGRGLGRPERGPRTAQAFGMAFVGEVDLSGPPTAQGASRRRAVWPFRVQRSSGSSRAQTAAELSTGRSLPARLPLVSLMRCKRPAELTAGTALPDRDSVTSGNFPAPAGGPRFAAFSHSGWSWVGRSKFDTKHKPALSSFAGEWVLSKAGVLLL